VNRRAELLHELVNGSRPVADVSRDLSAYGWDSEEEIVIVASTDVITVLQEYSAGRCSAGDVRAWAEVIEGRDDIGFVPEEEEMLRDTLFKLANPELGYALTPLLAQKLLRRLRA
jgi:hypothetical protein